MSWPGGKKIALETVKVYTRKIITTPKATVSIAVWIGNTLFQFKLLK
jgi:hypothetical protein